VLELVLVLESLESLLAVLDASFALPADSFEAVLPSDAEVDVEPFDDDELEEDERESVIYQPLPLNTMPTG